MPTVPDTNTIIQIAIISQYLGNRSIENRKFYNNQAIDKRLPELIYITRKDVQWAYNRNPTDSTLTKTGEYLYALCAPFSQEAITILGNSTQSPPVITGPFNESVFVGNTATFSVSVVSVLPVTYQWFRDGVLIPGAIGPSYSVPNAQLTDSGSNFFVRVSNAAGSPISNTAILTVSAALVGYLSYGDIDPAPALQSSNDPFIYQNTFSITHNANFTISIPGAASPNKYLIIKVPDGESIKNTWFNTELNQGTIPDFNWENYVQFGEFTYYYTRQALSLDISQPLIISAV